VVRIPGARFGREKAARFCSKQCISQHFEQATQERKVFAVGDIARQEKMRCLIVGIDNSEHCKTRPKQTNEQTPEIHWRQMQTCLKLRANACENKLPENEKIQAKRGR